MRGLRPRHDPSAPEDGSRQVGKTCLEARPVVRKRTENPRRGCMNGKLELGAARDCKYTVFGGPYMERPVLMAGVKLAAEIRMACDVSIPTEDFQTPDLGALIEGLGKTIDLLVAGKPVYVGCMGGRGRTGLFLASLAKLWGIQSPVLYVRKNYFSQAVETQEQFRFVQGLEFPWWLRMKAFRAKCRGLVGSRGRNLTRIAGIRSLARPYGKMG